jgi:hypothetical protein
MRPDPISAVAVVMIVVGSGLLAWWGVGDDDAPAQQTARHRRGEGTTASGKPGSTQGPGWVPARAREAVGIEEASRALPSGPSCLDSPSPLDAAKEGARQIDLILRQSTRISDADESALGDQIERSIPAAPQFRGKWDLAEDRQRYGHYLQSLVDHLARGSTRSGLHYRVHLLHDEGFNAFALPGGVLAVHTGLLRGPNAVRSEAELAVVLGHEIAHVELRHTIASYQYARVLLGDDAEVAAVVIQMLRVPLSTTCEEEADDRGLVLAEAGQYDPFAACRLWARSAEPDLGGQRRGDLLDEFIDVADELLRSHPPSSRRCARTKARALELSRSTRFARWYRGTTNLERLTIGPSQAH